jgi:hypothetical protein
LEAGAHPDDVLFKGEVNDGQISGTAYISSTRNAGKFHSTSKDPFWITAEGLC